MKRNSHIVLTLVVALLLVSGVTAVMMAADDPPPALPADTLAGDVRIVMARPFTLDVPYTHWYRQEQPQVDAGVALVLSVSDRTLIHPRQTAEPVLYVGAETAERLNVGHQSGHVVAIVPAATDADGNVTLDLSTTPIFFGDPELPERIDAAEAARQLDQAVARGIAPATQVEIAAVLQDQVRFENDDQLRLWAADIIEAWSPQEVDLVSGLRAPRVGR